MNKKQKRLSLINYEGDNLWAIKVEEDKFIVYDQHECIVDILDFVSFCSFLDGDINLIDSDGKIWNYLKESQSSKSKINVIFDFISSETVLDNKNARISRSKTHK